MRKLLALTLFDMKYVFRDLMLMVAIVAPFMMALLFRFGLPQLNGLVSEQFGFSLEGYSELFAIILIFTVAVMLGMFASFVILDERDEDVLMFLAVTPLSNEGYFIYRLGAPVVISTVLSFLALLVAGYGQYVTWLTFPVILLVSLVAPLVALFIASVAKNKVEGLAVAKVASILMLVPLLYFFVDGRWKYIGGWLPPFWVTAAYYEGLKGFSFFYAMDIVLALLSSFLFIRFLFLRFKRIV